MFTHILCIHLRGYILCISGPGTRENGGVDGVATSEKKVHEEAIVGGGLGSSGDEDEDGGEAWLEEERGEREARVVGMG